MAEQDQETSKFTVRHVDLEDPDLYRLNQIFNFTGSQISAIRNNGRFTGTSVFEALKAKLLSRPPQDDDVVPWGTIKRYLSPAATRQAFITNNWFGTPTRNPTQGGGSSGGGTGDNRFTSMTVTLTANTTIASPYTPTENDFLTLFVVQGAGPYTIAFDPEFAPGFNTNIPATNGMTTVFQFRGRSDNLWWCISPPIILE